MGRPRGTLNPKTRERRRIARKMYRAGSLLREIGEKLGITRQGVYSMLSKMGEFRRRPGGPRTKARTKAQKKRARAMIKAAELYRQGFKVDDIERRAKVCHEALAIAVREAHIPLRGSGGRPPYELPGQAYLLPLAAKLYKSGLSLAAVGERVGYCQMTIQRWFVKNGIARRCRGRPKKGQT